MSLVKIFQHRLEEEGISDIDKILEIFVDILPDDNTKKKTIDDLLRYSEKIYQKKYGKDEIFVSFPIASKLRIQLVDFKKRNNIEYKTYCNFANWLLEINNTKMSVYDLQNQKLYNKFLSNYEEDKKTIKEKKQINNRRILEI
jgi:hypothetical protein